MKRTPQCGRDLLPSQNFNELTAYPLHEQWMALCYFLMAQ